MTDRECGGCTACCTVNGIEELDKPIRTVCPHECEAGCAIYDQRPQSCRNMYCVWLRGYGQEYERPDRLGLFIEERPGPPDGRQFIVKELEPGAAERNIGYLQRLKKASGGVPVYVANEALDKLVGEVVEVDIREHRRRRKKRHERKRP